MPPIVHNRSGVTRLACGVPDHDGSTQCQLTPGHSDPHMDSHGKQFDGSISHQQHLRDLPRYLRANGDRVIAQVVSDELERWASVFNALQAVIHQMEHGESADFINATNASSKAEAREDLVWCRRELQQALKTLS